ncbi:MAG TPA: hypothetical protein VK151_04790 [Fluviicola sp.]|nr:hypothetical protein [Fluviicola sp.]
MRTHNQSPFASTDSSSNHFELVKQGLIHYLTISTIGKTHVDPEELEWSMQVVAEQLQQLLNVRGVKWEIPLFEQWRRLDGSPYNDTHSYKLMLRLPDGVTWNDYDKAIKRALELRRDSWVVQIRYERIVEEWCLKQIHKGSYGTISATVREMTKHAAEENMKTRGSYHLIFLNDPEQIAEKNLETVVLIPVER